MQNNDHAFEYGGSAKRLDYYVSRVNKLLPSGIWNAQMYSVPFERVKATKVRQ